MNRCHFFVAAFFVLGGGAAAEDQKPQIDLNTATQQQLESLPGIGPVKAKAIIAAREKAPFKSVDDLDWVPGITPKLLADLRALVQVKTDKPAEEKAAEQPAKDGDEPAPAKKAAAKGAAPRAANPPPAKKPMAKNPPDDPDVAAMADFRARLAALNTAQLKSLLAEKKVDFQRWCELNFISSGGTIKKGFATTREREAALVAAVREWKKKLSAIETVLKEREKAAQ